MGLTVCLSCPTHSLCTGSSYQWHVENCCSTVIMFLSAGVAIATKRSMNLKKCFLPITLALSTSFPKSTRAFSLVPFAVRREQSPPLSLPQYHPTRMYSSPGGNDNGNRSGIFSTISKAIKSILPRRWFQSEEELQRAQAREKTQQQVKGGIRQLLKDAPFPIRMMGSMMTPLFSNALAGIADAVTEQHEITQGVLSDVRSYLLADYTTTQVLGDGPIQVDQTPVSLSSRSSYVNGKSTTQVDLAVHVQGTRQAGIAKATSLNGKLTQLVLQASDGRSVQVSLSGKNPRKSSSSSRPSSPFRKNYENAIEAEIIEKQTNK